MNKADAWWYAHGAGHDPGPSPFRGRLRADGRRLVYPDGARFHWRGLSAFRLLQFIAIDRPDVSEAYCAWARAHGVSILRVFAMCRNLFTLTPAAGMVALPALLRMAERHGLYLEVVALVDTATQDGDLELALNIIAAICDQHDNANLLGANEPRHRTQDPRVVEWIKSLRPGTTGAPYAYGAAHGSDDESREFTGGDFVTVHFDRQDGDGGWRHVRHVREGEGLSADVGKFVVDDEPIGAGETFISGKRESDPAKWYAKGVLARIFSLGATFHYEGGLLAVIPSGNQLACFTAWMAGLRAIPDDFAGAFKNAGWADSPVHGFDTSAAVRVYSAVAGTFGWTCSVGVTRDPMIRWGNGWQPVGTILQHPGVMLQQIQRIRE